jgi:sarcosine oxidase subunit delta
MLRIPCPFCGERDHPEFAYGGDASVHRPALEERSLDAWHRYVFLRDNPKGPHREFWQHVGGCRAWLVVERDTKTHAVHGARLASDDQVSVPAHESQQGETDHD